MVSGEEGACSIMANKFKRIIKDPRVIIVMIVVLISIWATGIPFTLGRTGVVVHSVDQGSAAYNAGMRGGQSGETILAINGNNVASLSDYASTISSLEINQTVAIETNRGYYRLVVQPQTVTETLPELENKTVAINATANTTLLVNKTIEVITGPAPLGIGVASAPTTNLKLGLDLQGGARVVLQPETKLAPADMQLLISNMNRRLNIFGLSDVVVRDASDISGNNFIVVEVAGANENDVRQLVSQQGKFEAKIANQTVFTGGELTDVCKAATCSGIDFNQGGCAQSGSSQWSCRFYFTITLSQQAAAKQAAATAKLAVTGDFLSQPLDLYLDNQLVDSLQIGKELKGSTVTSVKISGSGTGSSKNDATKDAISNMKRLQTILITGSLPVKLNIVRTDTISPVLGQQFLNSTFKAGLVAILVVVTMLSIAYRKFQIAIPIMMTSLLEIFILLGVASIIKWSIDLAAIAGIIAAVGTGVNDQIIITDEALRGTKGEKRMFSWKEKIKSAFSIIFGAFFTVLVAMLPLFAIGAGMLRGFALTTIIGMSVGVFITRPAYAKVIEILMEKD